MDVDDDELPILYKNIARVLDGQHRIEGLKEFREKEFGINVTIFVDIDISDQANIFSTVNLAQTKVHRSLAYDLFSLAKTRSPQKTCHNIAVTLDQSKESPFFHRIKRLGVATEGRFNETITQSTFVQSLLRYLASDPMSDRDMLLRGKSIPLASAEELEVKIFRNMFLEERDVDIGEIVWNYFDAVARHWPKAWASTGRGDILNKTNGFKALMRLLRPAYLYSTAPGGSVSVSQSVNCSQKSISMITNSSLITTSLAPVANRSCTIRCYKKAALIS